MPLQKIDRTKPEFKEMPEGTDGQILVEKVYDDNGNYAGCICCDEFKVFEVKEMTDSQKVLSGWDRFRGDVDSFVVDESCVPNIDEYKAAVATVYNRIMDDPTLGAIPSIVDSKNKVTASTDIREIIRAKNAAYEIASEDEGSKERIFKPENRQNIKVLL